MPGLAWVGLAVLGFAMLAMLSAAGGAEAAKGEKSGFPQTVIGSDVLKLTVYLPDADKGFYRGARFDASGQVLRAEFAGHTVFGPFRPGGDPTGHDHCSGPAEEFDIENPPPGYAEAKPGEPFVKIGVGLLLRGDEPKYEFWRLYKFARPPVWQVRTGPDWIEFQQDLSHGGWGYSYVKRIALAPGATAFTIAHTLRNTGTKSIDSLWYCHNFIIIDEGPVGPDYRVTWPFELKPREARGKAEFKGKELTFPEEVKGSVWIAFEGGTGKVEDNQVTVENRRTGAGVKIAGDQPLVAWRFYAEKTAACPEPFVRIQVAPGGQKKWSTTYTFFAAPKEEER